MQTPLLSAIAALGKHRELGKNNELIWRISADLQRVKTLTTGHPIIMGRKTYESIGRPLPNRTNIVISRNTGYRADGCLVVDSLQTALARAKAIEREEIFIFGGAAIYELALPVTDRLYLTVIDAIDPEADTFFPPYLDDFTVTESQKSTTVDGLMYEWQTLDRIKKPDQRSD